MKTIAICLAAALSLTIALPATPADAAGAATVCGGTLNLRSGPGANSRVLASYRNGTKLTVVKQGHLWFKVQVRKVNGWMNASYLCGPGTITD